jgi:hypothetical protein
MNSNTSYATFLEQKSQSGGQHGFAPLRLPDFLIDFQSALTEWAIRRGRAAIFASCGLGKTVMYLVWAENVVRHTNRPVLVATTLGDSAQAIQEAQKFGVETVRSRDGKIPSGARIVVTNYERLHYFNHSDFSGMVANESGILKNAKGKTKAAVTEFLRTLPYRLLCTATPSPNDYVELGTSSEALGELGYQDMLTRFFTKHLAARGTIGWGREQYRMKGHAERAFWQWVCSWARACRKPSDLGFDDTQFILPELVTEEHVIQGASAPGFLFDMPAVTLEEQREELHRTLRQRCEAAASFLTGPEPGLAWCYFNEESKLLTRLIPGAVEVSGSQSDEEKEEAFEAFQSGQIRVLVSKPKIAGYGLNWMHCARMTFFISHSWEQWHQSVRRCWRFGQTKPVHVHVIATPGILGVLGNLRAKEEKVERMFSELVDLMNSAQGIHREPYGTRAEKVPAWLNSTAPSTSANGYH